MFYSAYDNQCGGYFSTGRNSKTRDNCIMEILNYLMEDEKYPQDDIDEDFLNCFDVEIHEHAREIFDDED